MYQVVNMENLRSGELYVFSDNEFFNPPSYAVVSGWACDGISLSVLMTESPLPEPSMRIDWDCRLPRTLVFPFADRCGTRQVFPHAQSMR